MTRRTPADNVVIFDGECTLCSRSVQFIISNDSARSFRFASAQSERGAELLAEHGIDAAALSSVLLLRGDRVFRKADAVLEIAGQLGIPWRWLRLLRIFPRPLRDAVYDFVAARRHRWFGRRKHCMLPTEEMKTRFLE